MEYERLLKVSKKIFRISDTQGRVLKKREYEIKNLLDNANQGFLTCGKDLIVDKEYSAECIRIFDNKICNLNIVDLLSNSDCTPHNKIQIEATLYSIFNSNDDKEKEAFLGKLPSKLLINGKNINVEYKLIGQEGNQEEILLKPGSLTHEEWEVIKSHSEIGYRMAQSIGEPVVAEAILALHERWDGNGYPRGLKGEKIPYIARLLAIVDSFDVMTHERVYRYSLSVEEAKREVLINSGTQFDPLLAKTFLDKFNNLYETNRHGDGSLCENS